jgi:hypothetical protein
MLNTMCYGLRKHWEIERQALRAARSAVTAVATFMLDGRTRLLRTKIAVELSALTGQVSVKFD